MTRNPHRQSELRAAGAVPVVQDAFDGDGLARALQAIGPEAVIHQLTDLALLHEPDRLQEALERNARLREVGTANLVAAAVSAGVERIVAQSIAWSYRPGPEPCVEEAPLDVDATGARGRAVRRVATLERTVLSTTGVRGCVLRYGQLYGPGTGSEDAVGKEIPLHVEAAAWASVLALEQRAAGIYNVAEANDHVSTEKVRRELGWRADTRAIDGQPTGIGSPSTSWGRPTA